MDYLKKSMQKLDLKRDYDEIDTRLASGWYVENPLSGKKKVYKTNKITYKLSKKNKKII